MTHSNETIVLPGELDEITADFTTMALSQRFPDTRVASVEQADLRQGSASSLRLRLEYDDNPHQLPTTLFMKGDFIDHEFTSAAAFAGEAIYYEHVAPSLQDCVHQPVAYFAAVDQEDQAIVILEDLAARDVTFGECDSPLDVDTVADGVRQLAAMHAKFWRGRGLETLPGVEDVAAVADLMMFLVQPDHFDDYIDRERAAFLSTALRDRLQIESALKAMFDSDQGLPQAFIHGDPHLGNTFRETSGKLGFCDFQSIGRGPYIWDFTYFVTGSLIADDRSRSERDLLALYLDELRRRGADDVPSVDSAFLAHRRHMMHGYLSIVTPVEMQSDNFAVTVGKRFAAAMEDIDTLGSFQ